MTGRKPAAQRPDSAARRRFRGPAILLAGAVVVAIVYSAGWFAVRAHVLAALESQSSGGIGPVVGADGPRVGGFPLAFGVRADALSLSLPDGAAARGEAVTAGWRPWRPLSARADVAGPLTYRVPTPGGSVAAAAEGGAGLARLSPLGRLSRARVDVAAPRIAGPDWRVEARSLEADLRAVSGGLAIRVEAAEARPGLAGMPSGALPEGPIERLAIAATARPRPDLPFTPAGLARWRDAGGTLTVDAARLDWGTLSLEMDGRIALDAELRPTGRLEARIEGAREVVEALVAAGVLRPADAGLILGFLGGLSAEDGATVVPVRMGDGWLALGPVPVARLAPVM
ncbi:MAG: DUF2125 domain-containing protein [Azospirillaceae bacterium]